MSYSMWVEVSIDTYNSDVSIQNVELQWGKLYQFGNKDIEISPSSLNGTVIKEGTSFWFCACGRGWSPSGTQGSFQLFDPDNKLIGTYNWDCPIGEHYNQSSWVRENDTNFQFDFHSGNCNYYGQKNKSGTQIGRVTLRLWDASKPPYVKSRR
ncbi:aegerolysin family protein [Cohnella faecalis]|uniref:Uncharacterized protein n=1 Tax=Cohnella faecalis TaxID=2315694 RepID=A0A398CT96_9BACL|nr:aegerolysin family protein [Cohnella faecalis]RIE05380.1 hypothetical protein D3H35_00925 [Cohnella faecalis]